MGDKSKIEWTDATWPVTTGCTRVSPGCEACYAERLTATRLRVHTRYAGLARVNAGGNPRWTRKIRLNSDVLDWSLRWKRPRRIFVASMSDLFHEKVPDEFIGRVSCVMAQAKHHTFQVLTKRPERMQGLLSNPPLSFPVEVIAGGVLPNVWLGTSVEDQTTADARIPLLLQTPAAVRFLSVEPLLGPVDLRRYLFLKQKRQLVPGYDWYLPGPGRGLIHWVIVGGESGGPSERALVRKLEGRPVDIEEPQDWSRWRPKSVALEWVRSIRDQCVAAGVPFFFKQWGGPTPKSGGRLLDGEVWDEMPKMRSKP